MNLYEFLRVVDDFTTATLDQNGYGYHDSQRSWEYNPTIEQSRTTFQLLIEQICEHMLFGTYLQIGLGRHGGTHYALGLLAKRMITIEIDRDRLRNFAEKNPNISEKDFLIPGDSADPDVFAKVSQVAGELDFLLIDGGDTYEQVKSDWEMYSPLVRQGGIVAIADASQVYPEIREAFDIDRLVFDIEKNYLIPRSLRFKRLGGGHPIHYYCKTAACQGQPTQSLPKGFFRSPGVRVCGPDHLGFKLYERSGDFYAVQSKHKSFNLKSMRRHEYDLVLRATNEPTLQELIGMYSVVAPQLSRARLALRENRLDDALEISRVALAPYPGLGPALQQCLNAYPHSRELLIDLGTICVFVDRRQEGLCLLMAALDRNISDVDLLKTIMSIHRSLFSDEASARQLIERMRKRVRVSKITGVCREDETQYVLWGYPKLLEEISGVIQIGAHVGEEVEVISKLGILNQVYFEPHPEAYHALERQCQTLANPLAKIRLFNCAVAKEKGNRDFWLGSKPEFSSLLREDQVKASPDPDFVRTRKITVPTLSLDQMVAAGEIDGSDYNLLLLDSQGADLEVLEGAIELLKNIDVLCITYRRAMVLSNSILPEKVMILLEDNGFLLQFKDVCKDSRRAMVIYTRLPGEM